MKEKLNLQEKELIKVLYAEGRTYYGISKEIKRSPHTIKKYLLSSPQIMEQVQEIKQELADMFDGLAKRMVSSITDEDIKNLDAYKRTISGGIAVDKMRLLRGEATQNISYQTMHLDLNELIKQTKEIQRELNILDAEIEAKEDGGEVKKLEHNPSEDENKQEPLFVFS